MRRTKYALESLSWEALWEAVRDHEEELGVRVGFTLRRMGGKYRDTYVEVQLHEGDPSYVNSLIWSSRSAFLKRGYNSAPPVLLRALTEAVDELERQPWCWSLKMRADRVKEPD